MNNLAHKKILILRPEKQSQNLIESIDQLGGMPISLPTLEIVEIATTSALLRQISKLPPIDISIFTSVNAVEHGIRCFKSVDCENKLARSLVIPMGPATAEAIEQAGLKPEALATDEAYSSESLLNLGALQELTQKTVAIITGLGGRTLLQEALTQRGARVERIECYQRRLPTTDTNQLAQKWLEAPIDIIVATSGEALENLFKLFDASMHSHIRQTDVLLASARLVEIARSLCFQGRIKVARSPQDRAVLTALCEWREGML